MNKILPTNTASEKLLSLRYEGYFVSEFERRSEYIKVQLEPLGSPICPNCNQVCPRVHSKYLRRVQDISCLWPLKQYVEFYARRVRCSCGCRKTEKLSWVEPKARLTNALISQVQYFLRTTPTVKEVGQQFGLSWDTVRVYDRLQLKFLFSKINWSHCRHLAIDEFLLHKGHRYATVVMDVENRQVLWVGRGKSKKSIQPFFDELKARGLEKNIESVCCDMNAAYPTLVKENLPNCKVVYDLFHVMQNFREVLTEARKHCINEIQKRMSKSALPIEGSDKWEEPEDGLSDSEVKGSNNQLTREQLQIKALKSSEWLIIKRKDDLTSDKQEILKRVLSDNELLMALSPVAAMLREVWVEKVPSLAFAALSKTEKLLTAIGEKYKFKPAKKFAKMLNKRAEGIVYAGNLGWGTNRLEGANNKIKTARRRAYGFRDIEHFFLLIKSILPGIKRNPWEWLPKGWAVLKNKIYRIVIPIPSTNSPASS